MGAEGRGTWLPRETEGKSVAHTVSSSDVGRAQRVNAEAARSRRGWVVAGYRPQHRVVASGPLSCAAVMTEGSEQNPSHTGQRKRRGRTGGRGARLDAQLSREALPVVQSPSPDTCTGHLLYVPHNKARTVKFKNQSHLQRIWSQCL